MISCDLQLNLLNRIHHAFFIYNPYSIVNELTIAKTGAELNRDRLTLTADSRGLFSAAWMVGPGAGGADRDRTDDPLLAKQVLSQLSYSPGSKAEVRKQKAEGGNFCLLPFAF